MMDFFKYLKDKGIDYNEKQREAISCIDGPLLIVAGPGSGKTSVIAARCAYLIRNGIRPDNILVITFTRAAANEMRDRFSAFPGIREEHIKKVDFGTFHSTFYKIINSYYGRHLPVLDQGKAEVIIKNILKKMNEPFDDELVLNTINEISLARTTVENIGDYKSELYPSSKFASICSKYEAQKKYLKSIDFDDMMIICKRLLVSDENVLSYWRNKYRYFMIDEFQDSSCMQFEIIKMLCRPLDNICVVGDDDQSIYSFRGALPDCLRNFERDYENCKTVSLNINYRSTDEIVELSHRIISHNTIRKPKQLKSTKGGGSKPTFAVLYDESEEASFIADKIEEMMKKGYTYNDFAVLYRTNIQSRPVIDEFIKRNIPFNIKDSISNFFDHWVCRDITCYLRLSVNNGDVPSFLQIANRPTRYIPKDMLERISSSCGFDVSNLYKSHGLKEFQTERLRKLSHDLDNIKFMPPKQAVEYIRKSAGYDDYIRKYCMEMDIRPDELFDIMDEYEESSACFRTIFELLSHIQEVSRKLAENKKRYEYKKDSVTLSTVHGAKGLEFTCVFVIGLVEGYLPHSKCLNNGENVEEERRLFYVAATRAKTDLFVTSFKNRHKSAVKLSRFVKELDSDKPSACSKQLEISLKPGMLVSHNIFGTGVVVGIKSGMAEIRFNTAGVKHLDINTCIEKKLINF